MLVQYVRRSAIYNILPWFGNSKVRSGNSRFIFPGNGLFAQRPHIVVGRVEFDTSSWYYVTATHYICLFYVIMLMWHGVETAEKTSLGTIFPNQYCITVQHFFVAFLYIFNKY
jgi:hypothetical protein